MMNSQIASSVHCTCCHVCHVSMKQRPRQLLACRNCNTIICRTCLETRWKNDQWAQGSLDAEWVCHKCRGDCPCKSCRGKGALSSLSRKRGLSGSGGEGAEDASEALLLVGDYESLNNNNNNNNNNNDNDVDEAAGTSSLLLYAADAACSSSPVARVKRHTSYSSSSSSSSFAAAFAAPPGRQPSLPPGFQVTTHTNRTAAAVPVVPRDKMGLGGVVLDHNTPVHVKVVELSRQRDVCDANIASMRSLLQMLEQERSVIDKTLNNLVKQTAQEVGGELRRSNSQAQLLRSSSHCNLEDLAAMPQPGTAQKPAQGNVF